MSNPELRILNDHTAVIFRPASGAKGEARYPLTGGTAAYIISAYRHCLSHPGTGKNDAAFYLWGVLSGMEHAHVAELERVSRETEQHMAEARRLMANLRREETK